MVLGKEKDQSREETEAAEGAHLARSADWLISSAQLLGVKTLLKAVSYLSVPRAGEGQEKLRDYRREKFLAEAGLCEGHSANKVTGNRIIPQESGCTSDPKTLQSSGSGERRKEKRPGEPNSGYLGPCKPESRPKSCKRSGGVARPAQSLAWKHVTLQLLIQPLCLDEGPGLCSPRNALGLCQAQKERPQSQTRV